MASQGLRDLQEKRGCIHVVGVAKGVTGLARGTQGDYVVELDNADEGE